jgi:MFS family permease
LGRNYHRLWTASGFSNLADGIFQVALPLLALRLTRSPGLIAGVAFASRLPWLVFALQAGALADRLDRRRTMAAVDFGRMLTFAALTILVALDITQLWMLYVIAFALGVGETLFDTAAQSVMPMVVKHDQLSRANGRLYAIELTMNTFVGPPLGGILFGTAAALAFLGSGLAYLFGFLALIAMVGQFRVHRETPPGRLRTDIAEGLRFLIGNRVLRTFAVMTGLSNMASTAVFAVLPVYVVAPGPLGLSESQFGFLTITLAVGSLAASFVAERVERALGRANSVAIGALVTGGTVFVFGLWPAVPVLVVGFLLEGFAIVVWNVVTVSLRQRITPPHMLGRINASYRLLAWGSMPIGALIGGLLAEWLGVRAVFVVMGVLGMSLVLGRLIATDEAIDAAIAQTEGQPEPDEPEPSEASAPQP